MAPVPLSAQSYNAEQDHGSPIFLSADTFSPAALARGGPGSTNQGGDSGTDALVQKCMENIETWFQLCARDHPELLEHPHVMSLRRMIGHHRVKDFGTIPAEANNLLIGMLPLPRPSPQPSPPQQDSPPAFDHGDNNDSPDDDPDHESYAEEDTTHYTGKVILPSVSHVIRFANFS
ncbi:hypothetical protein H1R20_g15689, partial [Candolleomyces eurysporus]